MSKRPFEGNEEERRVRARVELETAIADLPYEMQQLILEDVGVRPLMRFARASKQSEEVAARVFAAVFRRDILWAAKGHPHIQTGVRGAFSEHDFWQLIRRGVPPRDDDTTWVEYKWWLAKIYHVLVDDLAANMYLALAKDLGRTGDEIEVQLFNEKQHVLSIFRRVVATKDSETFCRIVVHVMDEQVDAALARFETGVEGRYGGFTAVIAWSNRPNPFRTLFANLLLGYSPRLELRVPKSVYLGGSFISLETHE
jgi:hypothetical protein